MERLPSVLQWIKHPDLRLDKFISRRARKLIPSNTPSDWNYCSTDLNPADVASRPGRIKEKICS